MSKSRIVRVSSKREDSGVAEIVGAILLFAVLISLFTSFMVWYIPAQTTSNEVHYEQQTKSSMGSLTSQLHNGFPGPGSTISQSVDLGISGVSIFSPPQDTQFSILPQSTSFNASLAFNITLNVTNSTGAVSLKYFNESYAVSGIMASNGNTEYVTSINYVIEDGALFQNYGGSEPTNSLGPMPLGIVNNSGQYSLSLSIFGVNGQSVSYSSSQEQVVNMIVNSSQYYSYANGSSASIGGEQDFGNGITLVKINYFIKGTLLDARHFWLFSEVNSTNPRDASVAAMKCWGFNGLPFISDIHGNEISMANSQVISLASISSEYFIVAGT